MLDRLTTSLKRTAGPLRPCAVTVAVGSEHGDPPLRGPVHTLGGGAVILHARKDGQRAGVGLPGHPGGHFAEPAGPHGPRPTKKFKVSAENAAGFVAARGPGAPLMVWLDTGSDERLRASSGTDLHEFIETLMTDLPPTLALEPGANKKVDAVLRRMRRRVWSVELLVAVLAGPVARVDRPPGSADTFWIRSANLNLPLPVELTKNARALGVVLRGGDFKCTVEAVAAAAAPALANFLQLWIAGTARADLRARAPVSRRLSGTELAGPAAKTSAGTPQHVVDTVGALAAKLGMSADREKSLLDRVGQTFRSTTVYPPYGCQSEKRDGPNESCMHCPIAPEQRYYRCGGFGITPKDVAVTLFSVLSEAGGGRAPQMIEALPPCITQPPRNNTNNVWRLEVSGVFRALAEALAASVF